MIHRQTLLILVRAAVVVPIVTLVIVGAAKLLSAMGDAAGGLWLVRAAWVGGIAWAVNFVLLVLALAINAVATNDES